jgi:hypothetical protein
MEDKMAFRYAPPAAQNDLAGMSGEQQYLASWSKMIEDNFRGEIDEPIPATVPFTSVPWGGFPRPLMLRFNGDRAKALAEAEVRRRQVVGYTSAAMSTGIEMPFRQQDEYLEWVPLKKAGKIIGFAFTAEGPEYWEHLAASNKDVVRALYSSFAGRDVKWTELSWQSDVWMLGRSGLPIRIYRKGDYNPYNKVNMEEVAAHLTHPANTLGAEIDLAAKATVQRLDANGNFVSERRRLACCSNFGDPNRNSDPGIGNTVNLAVRGGVSVTLADPVGLYIGAFNENRIADSDGNPLDGWWRITRGVTGRGLRGEFGPPNGSAIALADVRVGNNEPLTTGGQLAELITMTLYARATPLGIAEAGAKACENHCCAKDGSAPDQSLLLHQSNEEACPDGFSEAFPELTQSEINPFSRREIFAGMRRGVELGV